MAQVQGATSGLNIVEVDDAETREGDLSPVETMLVNALKHIKRGNDKAAFGCMVDAVNTFATQKGYHGGAYE